LFSGGGPADATDVTEAAAAILVRSNVVIWKPERNREQGALVASMYQQARGVPCERRAVVIGGLPGADKDTILCLAGVDRSWYFTISIDKVLCHMAARDLIPVVEGMAPLDCADLAHNEAQFLAKRAGLRAMTDGRNLIWDVSMAALPAARALLSALRLAGYRVKALFAELTVEESIRRADAAHRRGYDEYLAGRGFGGRYIPPEAIRALALPPEQRSPTPAPALLSAPTEAGFLGGEITSLIDAYYTGNISLEDLTNRFRTRTWPVVPPTCPPEMKDAAPAVDDPEPYIPGSFDDVVLAYDLGKLSDRDYQQLAKAAASAGPSHLLPR
jgi:Zeta toxin